jgi:hypothetical protein
LFGASFLLGVWLVRSGRVTVGAVLVGLLALFEVLNFPLWEKNGTADWIITLAFLVVSIAALAAAAVVLATRRRTTPTD